MGSNSILSDYITHSLTWYVHVYFTTPYLSFVVVPRVYPESGTSICLIRNVKRVLHTLDTKYLHAARRSLAKLSSVLEFIKVPRGRRSSGRSEAAAMRSRIWPCQDRKCT